MQATTSFEVSLQGVLPASDLDAVLQRCSLICSSSSTGRFHWKEVIFDAHRNHPNATAYTANNVTARSLDVKLACRKDLDTAGNSETPWRCYAYQAKPEVSKRHVTLREATVVIILAGNAMGFASALGYQKVSEICKRGFEFERGRVVVHIFRVDQIDPISKEVIPAPEDSPWHVEVQTAPIRNPPPVAVDGSLRAGLNDRSTIEELTDAVLEFKAAMKGLMDLAPFPAK